jgi:hypothetical protein
VAWDGGWWLVTGGWWLIKGALTLPRLASILLHPTRNTSFKYVDLSIVLSIHYSCRLSNATADFNYQENRYAFDIVSSCLELYIYLTFLLSSARRRKYDGCHIWNRAHHDPRSSVLA